MVLGLPLGASRIAHWLEPVFAEAQEILHGGTDEADYALFGIDGALILASVASRPSASSSPGGCSASRSARSAMPARPERVRELTARVPFLYRASLNKWWFDDLNHLLFIVIGGRSPRPLWWFDREVVDGTVNAHRRATRSTSGRGLRRDPDRPRPELRARASPSG